MYEYNDSDPHGQYEKNRSFTFSGFPRRGIRVDFLFGEFCEEVEGKLRDCAEGLLDEAQITAVIDRVWHLEDQASVTDVLADLHWQKG